MQHYSRGLFQAASSHNLSTDLRDRIDRLPRHIRKELTDMKVSGCSPLFVACRVGNLVVVKYLIEKCDANLERSGVLYNFLLDEDYMESTILNVSPLYCACASEHLEIVKYLVRAGSDLHATCNNGSNPLSVACILKNIDIVKCLIEFGADIRKPSSHGVTYLIDSIGSLPLCNYLISQGADVNESDMFGKTALHYAVDNRNLEIVQLLLDQNADPFALTRSGDDALQIACIAGSQNIAHYLLNRIEYPINRRIAAVELIGATLIHNNHANEDVMFYWRQAHTDRLDEPEYQEPREAYEYATECLTIEELEAIATDEDALGNQGLLISERILGIDHEDMLIRLTERGISYRNDGWFLQCIDVWLLALEKRIEKHTLLDYDTCETAVAIVMAMGRQFYRNDPEMVCFEKIFTTFNHLASNIIEAEQLIRIEPAHKMQQFNYNCILQCLTFLMSLLLSVAEGEDERLQIEDSVRRLVRTNVRCVLTEETLLHLAVSPSNVIYTAYLPDEQLEELFPSEFVTRLLLDCGAPVDAFDSSRSTPLMVVSRPNNYEEDVINTLIEYGAHLDIPNKFGERPSEMLRTNPANNIREDHHLSLKCRCANGIISCQIPYWNVLPPVLERFVRVHEIPRL